jgi:hypothetical protein
MRLEPRWVAPEAEAGGVVEKLREILASGLAPPSELAARLPRVEDAAAGVRRVYAGLGVV